MSMSITGAVAALLLAQTAQLEEVVVTAQKRAENLQDTPIAISAVASRARALGSSKRAEVICMLLARSRRASVSNA